MAKKKYRANWKLDGVAKAPIEPEQIVSMEEEDAQPFVDLGVLSPVGAPVEEAKGE